MRTRNAPVKRNGSVRGAGVEAGAYAAVNFEKRICGLVSEMIVRGRNARKHAGITRRSRSAALGSYVVRPEYAGIRRSVVRPESADSFDTIRHTLRGKR